MERFPASVPQDKGCIYFPPQSNRTDSLERIARMLRSIERRKEFERRPIQKPSMQDIVLHCVRLAYEPLGIDVKDIDAHGDLTVSKFKYIEVEVITGGLTNILYKVTNSKNGRCIAVRIFGNNTEQFIDRTKERIIQSHLCVRGFAKRIYAHFNGGQIEQWLEGETISEDDFQNFKYGSLIAHKVYELHNSPGQRELYLKLNPHVTPSDDIKLESILWPNAWKIYNLCIENIDYLQAIVGKHFDLREIKAPMEKLQRICNKMNSPVVLCHGDLTKGNLVIDSSNSILLLDFEYSGFMERGFDIANHFGEYAEYNNNLTPIPPEAKQLEFIRHYLGPSASDEAVDALYKEVVIFLIVPNMYWGLWGLLQCVFSSINADFACYSINRIQRFLHGVKEIKEV